LFWAGKGSVAGVFGPGWVLFRRSVAARSIYFACRATPWSCRGLAFGQSFGFRGAQICGDPPTDTGCSGDRIHGDGDAFVAERLDNDTQRSRFFGTSGIVPASLKRH
jgi:hypothetical protein